DDADDAGTFSLPTLAAHLQRARDHLGERLWLGVRLSGELGDELWLALLQQAGAACGVPLVATGGVVMHRRSRKNLHDVITAVSEGRAVADCGFALQANAQRYLRYRARLAQVYPPELLAATQAVAARCRFTLESIRYNYPLETVRAGCTPIGMLARLTLRGARRRYPQGLAPGHRAQLAKELRIIHAKRYEMFFLTVEDIVRYARSQGILCQGRGSAANSAVCYCLGATAVDPGRSNQLFERFISRERKEPPDIDVDFEHERREEVIQYIYRKYGRERAAITAVVASYRTRSAIRDVGKALGLPEPLVDAFAKDHFWFDERELRVGKLHELAASFGHDVPPRKLALWLELSEELMGFPRHLSQHVGGFVLTQGKLTRLVPVENAAMADRSVIQWDKDDLDEMGLLKVDVLALGILTAIRRCLDLVSQRRGVPFGLHDIPDKDQATYDMICRADTVGVFQIESRAQMSMLPRLKPRVFYDIVIEVAIVRPGPIIGKMIHPYLQARERRLRGEEIRYESDALRPALERTLGIPIFQEQVMQISMIAAGFSADQADQLRRSMAAWKRSGGVHKFEKPLIEGMLANGYREEFARQIFQQILGFGEYGFPESHAYSFGLLAYDSSWLKCHEPACFLAAMLNSQPMGFYAPSQLIQDAKRHGVVVLPVDVCSSDWDSKLGSDSNLREPVRLGLRLVGGLSEAGGQRIVAARGQAPFTGVEDMALRAQLDVKDINALAAADALRSLAGHRRQQVWEASAQQKAPGMLREAPIAEEALELPPAHEGEEIFFDYASTGFTLRRHPVALLRPRLARMKLLSAEQLHALPHNRKVGACGIVTVRQQPQTAHGTIFVTLEDETGPVNVIVWKHVREQQRDALLHSKLMAVRGVWQRDVDSGGQVRHLIAETLEDLTPLLGRLGRHKRAESRDFH
ncbi:MAG: error-prone DNA polymerase, partial [Ramlibacter sp.]